MRMALELPILPVNLYSNYELFKVNDSFWRLGLWRLSWINKANYNAETMEASFSSDHTWIRFR